MTGRRSDAEVMQLLRDHGGLHERVRRLIASHWGKIEQAVENRGGVSGIELRRLEYECVDAVIRECRVTGSLWAPGSRDTD